MTREQAFFALKSKAEDFLKEQGVLQQIDKCIDGFENTAYIDVSANSTEIIEKIKTAGEILNYTVDYNERRREIKFDFSTLK